MSKEREDDSLKVESLRSGEDMTGNIFVVIVEKSQKTLVFLK